MKYNQILSSVFIVLICIPLVGVPFSQSSNEIPNHKESAAPQTIQEGVKNDGFIDYFQRTNRSYSETFGFRNQLIHLYNAWKVGLLKESSSPKVVLGKEGWLFLRDSVDHFDKQPLTNQELESWLKTLESQAEFVEKQGGRFLFVVTPTKANIYSEFLPDHWKSRRSSHADQLVSYLNERSEVEILDLRAVLVTKKTEGLLYDKTDTHWNDRGAGIAAKAILEELGFHLSEPDDLQFEKLKFEVEPNFAGDLSRLLMMEETFFESAIRLEAQKTETWKLTETNERVQNINGLSRPILISETENNKLPRVLIFRDSFCDALLKYLAPRFSKATYIWRNHELDTTKIHSEKPDIVIQQVAERFLLRTPTFQPGIAPK